MEYSNGKIYKLVSSETDDIYIGSTCTDLMKRKGKHKSDYKSWKDGTQKHTTASSKLFDLGGCVEIILIETYPCKNKNELSAREQHWMDKLKCINKNRAQTTVEDKKILNREYRIKNQERLKANKANYYLENKDIAINKAKALYQQKKEDIKEKHRQVLFCVTCESEYTYGNKSRHFKSAKHLNYLQ